MEHSQAGANLVGEGEEVQFGPQLAVIPASGLFQAGEMRVKVILRSPGRAINSLQLGVLFAAAPIGCRNPSELPPVSDHAGARQMRASAEVPPHALARLGINVVVHGQLALANLNTLAGVANGRLPLQADELDFVRLCSKLSQGLVRGDNAALKTLAAFDNRLHLFF